ncbi:hypothetical protein BDV96DRAFT_496312 [Lophiotrema nucula]|uniref:Apple domain-containing protein n=1 Tax=Lophiotrema nucula TaxID=690887 RepID=A0A6A5Z4Y1_9PLEO|nr:hypothetical protein BDV96DRAFT_496312 [Lophiotrema nucula]
MIASTFLLTAFAAFATAIPTSNVLSPRAGGPAAKPIPTTCTVSSPAYPTDTADATYQPADSTKDALVYYAYYSLDTDKTQLQKQCLEQCYGLGVTPPCVAAYWADNLVVPAGYYGGAGGNLATGCLMYNRTLETTDFVKATDGHATDAYVGDIKCPS